MIIFSYVMVDLAFGVSFFYYLSELLRGDRMKTLSISLILSTALLSIAITTVHIIQLLGAK
jgi:hypothetical protein